MKNKTNKILIATGVYPPDIGGPATYVKKIRELFLNDGVDVSTVCYADKKLSEENDIFFVPRRQWLFLKYFQFFLRCFVLSKKSDVMYAHDLISVGIPCAAAKVLNKKVKFAIRAGGDFLWEKAYNSGWTKEPLGEYYKKKKNFKELIYLFLYKFVLSRADLIIFSSKWQRDLYARNFKLRDKEIKVIENAFPEIRNLASSAYNNTVVFAGRLAKIKNIDLLLEAALQDKSVDFKIYGSGPEFAHILKKIKKLNLDDRVSVQKSEEHDKLQEIFRKSLLVVIPSISEVSPNTLLECVSMSVPVACTKNCGYYNSFKNKVWFFNPQNSNELLSIIKKIQNNEERDKYIDKLKTIDKSRGWRAVVDEHKKLFQQL